jgi:hypothetical protein
VLSIPDRARARYSPNSLARWQERVRERDDCAAQLSGAPHILHSSLPCSARFSKSVGNLLNNFVNFRDDLIVPAPQHCISSRAQKLAATLVLIQLVHVLRTVELDYEVSFLTTEVCEKGSDRMLSAKFESLELAPA